nr:hypothetical protein [uncultured Agathobaculum sp.]
MIKEALQYIVDLGKVAVSEINDSKYSTVQLFRIPEELTAAPLSVHTLSVIINYITSGTDECAENDDSMDRRFVIHVEDYDRVYLYRELNNDKARECLIEAELSVPSFPFGRWMDMETFTINLQTCFTPDGDRDKLIQLAGTVRADQGVTVADDGMTQQVTARSGISLIQQVSVPNPVELVPFRTFTEIEQPASPFVFRMRRDGDAIMAALFAADADAWKNEAICRIRDYFDMELPDEYKDDVIILA